MPKWLHILTDGSVRQKDGVCFAHITKGATVQGGYTGDHKDNPYKNLSYVVYPHVAIFTELLQLFNKIPNFEKSLGNPHVTVVDSRNLNAYQVFQSLLFKRNLANLSQKFSGCETFLYALLTYMARTTPIKSTMEWKVLRQLLLLHTLLMAITSEKKDKIVGRSVLGSEGNMLTHNSTCRQALFAARNLLKFAEVFPETERHYENVDTKHYHSRLLKQDQALLGPTCLTPLGLLFPEYYHNTMLSTTTAEKMVNDVTELTNKIIQEAAQ